MNIESCYYLGYTSKVHGKQGELIINLDVDFPEEYKNLESVLIRMNKQDNSLIPFFISTTQLLNNGTLKIKIDDINTVDQAKELVGKELFLPLDTLPKLTGNQFYYHEVVNFEVLDKEKGTIGKINQVLAYPTHAIFEIINAAGKEILIPITDEIITNVNRENKTIEITAPEGLIEIYLE
ncbi:MAG: 16S rRNA processing protein RimM [Bacteroidetes bacterium CG2_30_32_10]|nr:MAG: 16S rRNA processing protein RimM [Bacteroidetes bacterium CG2_30_32_10]